MRASSVCLARSWFIIGLGMAFYMALLEIGSDQGRGQDRGGIYLSGLWYLNKAVSFKLRNKRKDRDEKTGRRTA